MPDVPTKVYPVPALSLRRMRKETVPAGVVQVNATDPLLAVAATLVGAAGGAQVGAAKTSTESGELHEPLLAVTT